MKYAQIVWDGKNFAVPDALGKPRYDQLTSTHSDNLVELAGRTCYDSLGTGRDSKSYHEHIAHVNHGSVWEHANLCFHTEGMNLADYLACCECLLNRPGIYVAKQVNDILTLSGRTVDMRITCNLRTLREWNKYPKANVWADILGSKLQFLAKQFAPFVMSGIDGQDTGIPFVVVEQFCDEEHWVSIFITNVSRGYSHEQVRHKFMTAVSQRSTRYVDESESPWIWHPLIYQYLDNTKQEKKAEIISQIELGAEKHGKNTYNTLVKNLQEYLISKGVDKFTARKQARGASRGFLGNSLMTELVFSANLAQWKRMLLMRASNAADAEIRLVFNEIFDLLCERFPKQFEGWTRTACADGMGFELKEGIKNG